MRHRRASDRKSDLKCLRSKGDFNAYYQIPYRDHRRRPPDLWKRGSFMVVRNYVAGRPRFYVNGEPGSGTAIRYNSRLRLTRGFRSLRGQSSCDLWGHDHEARCLYRDANSEQHDVATGLDTGGNRVGIWFQDASTLSIRRGADGLFGDRPRWSDPNCGQRW